MTKAKSQTRPYRKRKRAEQEEETRRRITEAAVELHGTVGPARTKITELAELAGVSRRTVYNHFPDEAELFAACSAHWASRNPRPSTEPWTTIDDPETRLLTALGELYEWYRRNRGMIDNVLRDAQAAPALADLMDEWWGGYMTDVVTVLGEGWTVDCERSGTLDAKLRLVVDFRGWQLLDQWVPRGERPEEVATEMVVGAVRGAPS